MLLKYTTDKIKGEAVLKQIADAINLAIIKVLILYVKSMLKRFLFVAFLVLLLLPQMTLADGAAFIPGPYDDRWDYNQEASQSAIIDYQDGVQKMILNVGFESAENDTVWIFPVPAAPEKVVLDILQHVPTLAGAELSDEARHMADLSRKALLSLEIYPIPFVSSRYYATSGESTGLGASAGLGMSDGSKSDVVVYETIEKEGITSQLITSKTSVGLFKYLREKNLNIKGGSLPALDSYIGGDYSFVVSWISGKKDLAAERAAIESALKSSTNVNFNLYSAVSEKFLEVIKAEFADKAVEFSLAMSVGRGEEYLNDNIEFRNRLVDYLVSHQELLNKDDYAFQGYYTNKTRGVLVSFPTDKIFYPLKLTSVYGSTVIPTEVRIVGYVKPQTYKDIASYVKTEYYYKESYYDTYGDPKNPFGWQDDQNIRYTKISLNAPSKLFSDDLWFTANNSFKLTLLELFIRFPWIEFVILFLVGSFLAGVLAALVAFWGKLETKRKLIKYGLIGFANILTILGVVLFVFFTRTRSLDEMQKTQLTTLKSQGLATWSIHSRDYGRKFLFVLLFSLFYVGLILLFNALLKLSF